MIGSEISHYRIIQRLGAGGMGEVYLAEDTMLGRRVALKLLPAARTRDEESLRRFQQEAKAASALNHPNILTIHEVGQADGHHFIATEFIDGETLRALLHRGGKLEIAETLDIAAQIASALAAAHDAGIVHRDIKPENVMLRRDRYVKVLDFGLAKLSEPAAAQPADPNAPTTPLVAHTESGAVVGTMQYMSPEQAAGKKVDSRSDIFSFGALLYEMVTGQKAFEGSSGLATAAAILTEEPKPLPATIPAELAKLILRCLRKDPSRRFQSMADLKVALDDLREESGSRRIAGKSSSRQWIVPAAILLLVIGALFIWQQWRPKRDNEPLVATALTTLPGVEAFPSLSPDGTHVVYSWSDPKHNTQDLYVRLIGSDSPLRLTSHPGFEYNPVWSPDGKWIAFFRGPPPAPTGLRSRELRLIPPLGGPERKLLDVRAQDFFPFATYLAWSPDSKLIIVTDAQGEGRPDALFVVSLETGEKRRLTNPQPPVLADTSPAISSDGRSLIFLRRTSWGSGELHLLSLAQGLIASGETKRLTDASFRADFPAWMPGEEEIVFSAKGSLWRMAVSGNQPPARIPYVGEDGLMPAISRPQPGKPARLVYVRSFVDTNLWKVETSAPGAPSTTAPVSAIESTRPEYMCQFSPDGRRVAFTSSRSGDSEIWVSDGDGSNAVQLTNMRAQETMGAHWSPDGTEIAFASNAEGEFDIYVVPAAGGKPRRLTSHPSIDICPTYSRDGKSIYFSSMRSGDYRVWKMPASGGYEIQITLNEGGQSTESLDGRSVYYPSVSVVSPLWRVPSSGEKAGGKAEQVVDAVLWFNYALLDRGLYYIDRPGPETRLQYLDFASGRSTTVARNLGDVSSGLTTTPDGRTILFSRVDASADDLMLVENFR